MKGKQLGPLNLVEAKLVLQPSRKGVYQLKPIVHYLDELGQNKSLQMESLEIKVAEVILEERMATGTKELDSLLLGGIPEGYSVVLTGAPGEERDRLIRSFLETGGKNGQSTVYIAEEGTELERLAGQFPSNFFILLCNSRGTKPAATRPNISRLVGMNLTNLGIALVKSLRGLEETSTGPRRVCIGIVSEVLLREGVVITRRWLSELLQDLAAKKFTILAVMDPSMHPSDQSNAVLGLFDGEISLYETLDPLECKKSIRVKKLRNQDYIKNPICLTRPK